MFWVVDLAIIAIIGLCIFAGYKRGLTQSIIKILSFVLALVISLILFKPVSDFVINNTKIDDNIKDSIVKIFIEQESEKQENENEEKEQHTTVAQPIITYMNEQVEKSTTQVKSEAIDAAANQVSILIINIGVVIVVLIITRLLLIFVSALTNLITKLPVIKQFDKLGGIIFGMLQGVIIVFMILAVFSVVAPIIGDYSITTVIGQSYIGSVFYNNNLLITIIF